MSGLPIWSTHLLFFRFLTFSLWLWKFHLTQYIGRRVAWMFSFYVKSHFYFIFWSMDGNSSNSVSHQYPWFLRYNTSIRISLQWRHNGRDSVSNHQPHDCSLNRLFRRRSKETLKLRATGLCAGNSLGKMFPFDDVIMILLGLGVHWVTLWCFESRCSIYCGQKSTTIISLTSKCYYLKSLRPNDAYMRQ